MLYSKPEVTKLASSLEAIQHPTEKFAIYMQDNPQDRVTTLNAYAADE